MNDVASDLPEIRAALTNRAGDIARQLLGEPNAKLSSKRELRWGTRGSLSVILTGSKAGVWRDHETNDAGDVLSLIMRERHCDFAEALAYARDLGCGGPRKRSAVAPPTDAERKAANARAKAALDAHSAKEPAPERKVVATYDYCDVDGRLLYQAVRYEPKDFSQRRPDGNGGWIVRQVFEGIPRVPYRWADLAKYPDGSVFATEGERDADNVAALGLCSTTVAGGVWTADCTAPLAGRDVFILEDNDRAGREKSLKLATALQGIAKTVRIVVFTDMPAKGDVSDWIAADPEQHNADALAGRCLAAPLWRPDTVLPPVADTPPEASPSIIDFKPYAFPDPASIPARQWLFGRHYIRGAVGASIGAPGRLKSTTVLTEIIGMSVGRDLMSGEALPSGALHAAYLNGEETQDELDRRVAATCQHFGVKPQDCGNRLWVRSTRDNPIRVAAPGPHGGAMVQQNVVEGLLEWCREGKIDVLAIDPLISFHKVRETDNGDMDLVVKEAFGKIAGETIAVELVHHPRKLAPGESNATLDDARGASAIIGAVRLGRTFNFMTTTEAGQLGILEEVRRRHVRIENGKANPGPIGKAHWVKIETENLPNGDEVACSTLWKPPNPFDKVTVSDLQVVQSWVQGGAFRTSRQSPDWLGWWMAEHLPHLNIKTRYADKPRNKAEVTRLNNILNTWVKNNALGTEEREDEKRRPRDFFTVGKPIKPQTATIIENDDEPISLQ